MPPSLVNHGTPVISSRQWSTALSPNPRGGWNFIACSWTGVNPNPVEWPVIKDLTTAPTEVIFDTPTHHYANQNFRYPPDVRQLRAGNGRIFFPCLDLYTTYYDETLESIQQIGPIVESPPVDPNASTILYSASFDVAGLLYMATQESHFRPSCVVVTDTTTTPPTQTILGYVGSGAASYTTYGYSLAPDTATATKYVYVVYGENPWQLWALDITTGATTKLDEVPSSGNIAFSNIAGQGWVATTHTDLGEPDDVVTQQWCLDGALHPYTPSVPPPGGLARNVTPASNPLVNPPGIDTSGGIGAVGWRANGSTGPYTYVNYSVNYFAPVTIESLVTTPDGVLGNAQEYQGFFRFVQASGLTTWFGAESGVDTAQPLSIFLPGAPDEIFFAGYPDGGLYRYTPANPWQTTPTVVNPSLLGYYGPSGNQKAGIKYAGQPLPPTTIGASGNLEWSPGAGSAGRLYCAGTRDRTGTGAGIGYWNAGDNTIAGTFASPLDTVQPQGIVALDAISRVAMSTNLLSGSGTAPLYVFDQDLNLTATQSPISGLANLGPIFSTSNGDIICGAYASGGVLNLYRWNVNTGTVAQGPTVTAFSGAIDAATVNQADGSVWLSIGDTLVRVDPDTLATTNELDLTSIAPTPCLAWFGTTLYLSSGATLYSAQFSQSAYQLDLGGGLFDVTGGDATLSIGVHNVLEGAGGLFAVTGGDAMLSIQFNMIARGGLFEIAGGDSDLVLVAAPPSPSDRGATITKDGLQYTTDLGTLQSGPISDMVSAGALPVGTPIRANVDYPPRFDLASASSEALACCVGLLTEPVLENDPVVFRDRGLLELTVAQWNAIVVGASTGLTPQTYYYLSASGKPITQAAPATSGDYVIAIGFALTTTVLDVGVHFIGVIA